MSLDSNEHAALTQTVTITPYDVELIGFFSYWIYSIQHETWLNE